MMKRTVTINLPDGYSSEDEFAKDCGFEIAPCDANGVDGFGKMLAWIVEGSPDRAQGVDAARRLRIYVWKLENELAAYQSS